LNFPICGIAVSSYAGAGLFTNSGSQQGPHIGIWKNVDHDINSKSAQAV
jgi:hypothetical protein